MKRETAIALLNNLRAFAEDDDEPAIDMAIEALTDRPIGEWTEDGVCSNCGGSSGTQFDGVQPIPLKTKFCPNCGAKMTGNVIR